MIATPLHWYATHAGLILAVVVPSAIVADRTQRWATGRDVEAAGTRLSVISALAFLGAKTVAGKLVFVAFGLWVYAHHRIWTLDPFNPMIWLGVFVLRDAIYYWVHRAEHRVHILWASHMIHHSPTTISATTAIRVPWMEALYKPWFSLWLPLIGFNPLVAITFDVFAAILGLAQHTTRFTRTTVLDKVFVTPSAHRVHHGSNHEYIDKNFGAVLIIWDRMFGTYQPEVAPVIYGIGSKQMDSTADLLLGGFPAIASDLRRRAPVVAKLRYLVARPGTDLTVRRDGWRCLRV
jgi:sterol desaturase/sphingolipid hydroxylase (fatty acid hydroxylase superfamily)